VQCSSTKRTSLLSFYCSDLATSRLQPQIQQSGLLDSPSLLLGVVLTNLACAVFLLLAVILQRVVWGRKFDSLVYWALIPIVFGVVLTTVAELSFNWTGFLTAMAACLTTSTSNIMAEALLQVRCFALLFENFTLSEENLVPIITWAVALAARGSVMEAPRNVGQNLDDLQTL
jgi:hypothetical protein